jgi:coenzyme F420 hydrogenase subunit delta
VQLLGTGGPVPDYCRKPVVVLGCGNILFGDDGLGPAVIERLEGEAPAAWAEQVCLLDVGTGARKVLFDMALSDSRPEVLLVVDAVDAGRAPGEVFALSIDDLPANKTDDFSMHHFPASNLLRELRDGRGVEVEILSCQVAAIPETVRPGLSEAVTRAVPEICRLIRGRVDGHARDTASGGA